RSELEDALSRTLAHIRRNKDLQACLCYLDLDQFKVINDTSGHIAGDELIKQVANVLRSRLRDTDFISRIGGDEFAFIIMDADENAALNLVEEICSSINSIRFSWKDKAYPVSASFGLVSIRPDSGSVQDLLSAVDSACYISKEQGRNRIHVYRPDDNLSARQSMEMAMVHKMNHAIDHGMFVLHYHPIISLSGTDESVHYEILLRMQDDDKSWILPGAFIPAAERYCLMSRIDRWVVHSVLQSSHAVITDDVWISINISAQSLSESSFLDYVLDELAISKIPPANICFEITETTAISNLTAALTFIKAIKSHGCLFSLDDFGSGLCSFGYLRQMLVDFIKIDGTFVKDVFNDSVNVAMIESIVNIAHVIGVKTIAEFVASPEILKKVRELGVDYAQGHSISHSMPLEDIVSLSDLSNG
ncbi:MAG: EAL domain-containing protein, partial [Pseudomonadota bacterium]|nr:EAL domain-containing protein [Pseudomonadota bacterium]